MDENQGIEATTTTTTSSSGFFQTKTSRIIFITLLVLICIGPILFAPNLPTHADWHIHMERAYNFKRCFWQGQLLPRWIDAQYFGYGLPVYNYYAPFVYYVFTAIDLFFRDILVSVKWIYVLPVALLALFSYLYLRRNCSPVAICYAMPFIIFSPPVHMYIYNNNWPGSIWAIPFIFLTLLGIDSFNKDKEFDLKSFLMISIGYGLMCLIHIATAFIFTLAMVPYFFMSLSIYRTKKFVKHFILSFVLGLGLASFYLVPAALEKRLVHADEVLTRGPLWDFSKNFLYTYLDRDRDEGYAWAIFDHRFYEVSNAIFALVVLICLFILVLNLDKIKSYYKETFRINIAVTMFVLTFLMVTPASIFVWVMLKPLQTIQFPWRFISLSVPFGAIVITYAFDFIIKLAKENIKISGLKFIVVSIVGLFSLLVFVDFINMFRWPWISSHALLKSSASVLWANEEYMPNIKDNPNWNKVDYSKDFAPSISSSNPTTDVKLIKWTSHERIFQVFSEHGHSIRLRLFYFPNWTVYIDGKPVTLASDPIIGNVIFDVPAGEHEIQVSFEPTSIRKNAAYVSLISFIILILMLFNLFSKKKKQTSSLEAQSSSELTEKPQEVTAS